jgi:DNA polymerase-3 subunit alpha
MGKKIPEVMQHEGEKFIEGALSKGFTRELAEEVFKLIEPFAGYAFNKAHSVCYALIAYWTAYLKSNYPEEYMASVMNSNAGQGEKISSAVTECLRLGVQVLLPDVNRSDSEFSVDIGADGKPAIRFGLAAVKNVGYTAVEPLVRERKDNGPYTTIEDLCRRADLRNINRRAMESLMKVGGLDSVGHRGSLLASVERIMNLSQIEVGLRESGQTNMFDLFGDDVPASVNLLTLEHGDVKQQERLAWEKELLGTFVSETPLSALAYNVPNNAVISRDSIDLDMVDQQLLIVGQVSSVRSLTTRDGKPFAAVVLDLLGGSVDVMVWPKVYQDTHELWLDGALLWIRGKVRLRDEEISIACDEVKPYVIPEIEADMISNEDLSSKWDTAEIIPVGHTGLDDDKGPMNGRNRVSTEKLWVSLEESNDPGKDEHLLREVMKLLMNHPGTNPVFLRIKTDGKLVTGELPSVSIEYWENLHEELVDIVGESGVHLEVLS